MICSYSLRLAYLSSSSVQLGEVYRFYILKKRTMVLDWYSYWLILCVWVLMLEEKNWCIPHTILNLMYLIWVAYTPDLLSIHLFRGLHPAVQMYVLMYLLKYSHLASSCLEPESLPQMCPVNLDKEEHGQLITMLLRYIIVLLRDFFTETRFLFYLNFSPFWSMFLPASGYVSMESG